jgi:adenosylcobinamide-GDP ribazoletransferase
MRSLRAATMRDAFGLLTTFGRRRAPRALDARALPWFPLVGAVLGGIVGAAWWVAQDLWPYAVAAAITLAVDGAASGLLHYDGLADAADGLLPHATRERRLEIMRDPNTGSFAVLVVILVVALRGAALATRAANIGLVVAIWCSARAVVSAVPARVPYARDAGLGGALVERAAAWPAFAVVPACALAVLTAGPAGAAAVVACVAAGLATIAFARRRLDGFTGDVLGAAIVIAETAGLVVAAARW